MRRRWRLATCLALVVATSSVLSPAPASAQFEDDGLGLSSVSIYTPDPDNRVVHVRVELTATNHMATEYYDDGSYRTWYFHQLGIAIPAEATNLAATWGGTSLAVTTELDPEGIWGTAIIDLARNLNNQETQNIVVTYDLPNQDARSETWTRVSPGHAFILPVPVGDPGSSEIRVIVPGGYEAELLGSSHLHQRWNSDEGQAEVYAEAIEDPFTFDAAVVIRNDHAFDRVEVPGDYNIEVASWPDDDAWSAFVIDYVERGLPVLEELIGQPWPVRSQLTITETSSPYFSGAAGWYEHHGNYIEMGDELDELVVIHELSHAWFNEDLFADRWIYEGLAEELAARTLAELGEPVEQPEPVDQSDPSYVNLQEWSEPREHTGFDHETEVYAYNTSYTVMRGITEDIGMDGLSLVLDAATDGVIAYQGDPDPEERAGWASWREFLDLVEEVGGATEAEALLREYVVNDSELAVLDERAGTRAAYDELEVAGGEWTPPLGVRQKMSRWQFDAAEDDIETWHAVLDDRDSLATDVEAIGLTVPAPIETAYESATDVEDVQADLDALTDAADDLTAAHTAATADHGMLTTIGLWGADPSGDLLRAGSTFVKNDADATETAANAALTTVEGASRKGKLRIATTVAVLALIAGLAAGLTLIRQRRRRARFGDDQRYDEDVAPTPVAAPPMSEAGTGQTGAGEPRPTGEIPRIEVGSSR